MKKLYKNSSHICKLFSVFSGVVLTALFWGGHAYAQVSTASDIAENITDSSAQLPGLVSVMAYLLAILFAVMGVLKLKDHVESPQQNPLREALIRFAAGGALFALPMMTEVMLNSFTGGGANSFDPTSDYKKAGLAISVAVGGLASLFPMGNFNTILQTIVLSFKDTPGLISAMAYLLAILFTFSAIIKTKEHVESPQQTPLREAVGRFAVGGALFALPVVYQAMMNSVAASGNGFDLISGWGIMQGFMSSGEDAGRGCGMGSSGPTAGSMGTVICNIMKSTGALPMFLMIFSYLIGLVLGLWGVLKLKDHILNPMQNPIWDGVVRLLAAGGMFALPTLVMVAYNNVAFLLSNHSSTGWNDGGVSGGGLDAMMVDFVNNIFAPTSLLMNWFGFVAGTIFVMIGIMRLLKSSQEGPRGPGGLGTLSTFVVGGALIAFSPMISSLSASLFDNGSTSETNVSMSFTAGMTAAEIGHVTAVISACVKFMVFVGLISIMRGFFILRDVAEGNQQASMMSSLTHLIGGAMAVNIGPVVEAVQTTLGFNTGAGDPGLIFN